MPNKPILEPDRFPEARLLRENALVLPPELSMALKVFVTLEGLTRQLDPEFDLATEFRPVLHSAVLDRYAPAAVLRRGRRTATELVDLITGLPRDLRRLIQAVVQGQRKPWLAFGVSFLPALGNAAYPAELVYCSTEESGEVARFTLYDTLAAFGRAVMQYSQVPHE